MANRNSKHKRLMRGFLAVFCLGVTFMVWGYLSRFTSGTTGPASVSNAVTLKNGATEREALLNEATSGGKKIDSDSESVLMNDPFISQLSQLSQQKWGLEKTAARRAWEITQGSKDIIVAVIDTGIDVNHKDLAGNLWVNKGESGPVESEHCRKQSNPLGTRECNKALNGLDDDGNGHIDDVHGWNFVHNDNQLTDNHGHGTHIAGIIGARSAESGAGVTGVSPNVSLMILKYYDPKASNSNNLRNTIQAIEYAVRMRAHIINYSGGGTDYSAEEFAAVKEAERAGILFVAAAGNERSNSDEIGKHYYPADYDVTNVISVTAVNKEETKVLPSSNYGVRTVDIAAPGEHIYSALPGNKYGVMTGTSQATAFVTGVAALIMAINRDFTSTDVKKYILRTGDEYATLLSKTGTAKLLNSYRALTSLDMGVSVSGVTATNTHNFDAKDFASDREKSSSPTDDPNAEPTESFASFGRDLIKAMQSKKGSVGPASEPKTR